jgi:hypothetical protein
MKMCVIFKKWCWVRLVVLLFCHYNFGNWVLFFQDIMTLCLTITLCYSWQIMVLQSPVPSPSIWATCEAILKQLSFILTRCVMN